MKPRAMTNSIRCWAALVAFFLLCGSCFAADKYRVQEILPASDASMNPHGLNSNGDAVGGAGLSHGGDIRVFFSQHGSAAKELQRATGSDYSEAKSINDRGQVVGSMNTASTMRGFIWTQSSGLRELGALPGDNASSAFSVNGSRAFLWNEGSGMENIGTLSGGSYSEATGINDAGEVVGSSSSNMGLRAFIWDATNGLRDLNTLIPSSSNLVLTGAVAINNNG